MRKKMGWSTKRTVEKKKRGGCTIKKVDDRSGCVWDGDPSQVVSSPVISGRNCGGAEKKGEPPATYL